jgi:hypothetical protein
MVEGMILDVNRIGIELPKTICVSSRWPSWGTSQRIAG